MSVQQTDNSGGVTGFVHTEDQFWVNGVTDRDGKAFKSVALACSSDYGRSWDNARRILTLGDKPAVASWSGTGDQVQARYSIYSVQRNCDIFFYLFTIDTIFSKGSTKK